jgi:glycosyltransferase involved in cell wall biosynthesis
VLLLKHLDRTRFEPSLCLFSEEGPFLRDVPPDVPISGLRKQHRWDAVRVVVQLAQILRKTRPHVVLSKLIYANIVANAANYVSLTKTPVVAVEEGVLSAVLRSSPYPRPRRALARWAYQRSTTVVVPSPGVAADLRTDVGVRTREINVIPNIVEVDELQAAATGHAPHPFGDDAPLIVTMGRLVKSKGQEDLVAAVALINERRACNLLLVGDGEDQDRLRALARELAIENRVKFAGFLAHPFEVIAQADIFVSPSYWESFGNAIVEAMALGLPVVSTLVPCGPEWIVTDRLTGIFAELRNPPDLAQKIELLLDDPEMSNTIAARGRAWARRNCDVDRVVAQYEQLLQRAAAGSETTLAQ